MREEVINTLKELINKENIMSYQDIESFLCDKANNNKFPIELIRYLMF